MVSIIRDKELKRMHESEVLVERYNKIDRRNGRKMGVLMDCKY